MRKKDLAKIMAIVLSATLLLSGCASTTLISSNPNGATLYLDGMNVGTTPYKLTDTKITGAETSILMVMDGYQDFNGLLKKNEKANVGAIVAGCFFLFPFFWATGYDAMHTYDLRPVNK
ncbi:MAG: PEGA domain-containing protein [Bacteroidales bacterium]|nr:PEGA domain-containing protein [Bacteroidales bacterium]